MTTILAALQAIGTQLEALNTTLQGMSTGNDYSMVVAGLNAIEDAIGGDWDWQPDNSISYTLMADDPYNGPTKNQIIAALNLPSTATIFIDYLTFTIDELYPVGSYLDVIAFIGNYQVMIESAGIIIVSIPSVGLGESGLPENSYTARLLDNGDIILNHITSCEIKGRYRL